MSPSSGPPWAGGWSKRKPPWWPDEEPWPPERPPWVVASERWRRRRNLGCLVLLVIAASFFALAAPWWHSGPLVILWIIAALVVLLMARWVVRIARATSRPVDELIDAAGRVQAGDFAARVTEEGPTEIRSLARAFNQMSERLQRTDTQRRTFMADVSHELRTPLTVIQGQLEAIRDGVYPADTEHIGPALEQVAVLERLVEDLRTLALSESGSLPLARVPVDLGALAVEVAAGFRATAEASRVALTVDAEPAVRQVLVDPVRVGSVLRNLVANAIRYTPVGGSVSIRVRQAGTHVELSVTDTSRGIDPALLPTVFERFSRSANSTGSGLGLAIARAIVEAHGGTIEAASIPGQGTAITVRLPIQGS